MFHHTHHRSLFPFILTGLTIALVVLMYYAFTDQQPSREPVVEEPTPVSAQDYESELRALTQTFIQAYPKEQEEPAKMVLIERTLQELLSLRVPSEKKELHFSLVVELNKLMQAHKLQNGKAVEAFEAFKAQTP